MRSFIGSSRIALAADDFAALAAHLDIVAADELRRAGRHREAQEAYGRAVARAVHWRSLFGRGIAEAQLGHEEAALADLGRALELRPQAPTLLLERSHVLRKLGNPVAAHRDLDVALSADPRDVELLHARAWLSLAHLKVPQDALRDARKLVHLAPRNSDSWQTYGAALLWGGRDTDAAIVAFRRAIVLGPDNADAWFGYGQAMFQKGVGDSLDAFASYAALCSDGARCAPDDVAWLDRFLRDPRTYIAWPGILFRWKLLSQLL